MAGGLELEGRAVSWLLEGDQPAVRYRTLLDILGRPADDPEARQARSDITKRGWASQILARQGPEGDWESPRSLYRPKYTATNWMALVLSGPGIDEGGPPIRRVADLFFDQWLREGGHNIFNDEVCIVGNTARMLTSFGYGDDPRVRRLFERLLEDQKKDGGWHCWESTRGSSRLLGGSSSLRGSSRVEAEPKDRTGHRARGGVLSGEEAPRRGEEVCALVSAPLSCPLLLRRARRAGRDHQAGLWR